MERHVRAGPSHDDRDLDGANSSLEGLGRWRSQRPVAGPVRSPEPGHAGIPMSSRSRACSIVTRVQLPAAAGALFPSSRWAVLLSEAAVPAAGFPGRADEQDGKGGQVRQDLVLAHVGVPGLSWFWAGGASVAVTAATSTGCWTASTWTACWRGWTSMTSSGASTSTRWSSRPTSAPSSPHPPAGPRAMCWGLTRNGTATGDSELNPAALPPTVVPMWTRAHLAGAPKPQPNQRKPSLTRTIRPALPPIAPNKCYLVSSRGRVRLGSYATGWFPRPPGLARWPHPDVGAEVSRWLRRNGVAVARTRRRRPTGRGGRRLARGWW